MFNLLKHGENCWCGIFLQPSQLRVETEKTPTEATSQTLLDEATRMYKRAAECHSIALALQATSPILPFTTIPLCFE